MRALRAWISRIAGFVRPGKAEREFAAELESHIEMHTDDNIRAGMTPAEARRRALAQIGGVAGVREAHRDRRGLPAIGALLFDFRLGGRMLVKYPGLTIVGGLAMAFAIWAGLVIFQVLGLFTHPTLPLSQGARLVEVRNIDLAANDEEPRILYDFLQWQSMRSLTEIGAWRDSSRNLIVGPADSQPVNATEMSVSGFRVADGKPLMGRMLVEADQQPAAPPVAVIGHSIWRDRFHSDPNVVGRNVQLGNEYVTVVGVMPEGFGFPIAHELWLPLKTDLVDRTPRSGPSITVFALIAPGQTMKTAQAELTTMGRRAAAELPATHQRLEPRIRPFAMMVTPDGPDGAAILYSVYFFVGLLLVLTCGNVGLLLFARAASREADLVVRTALGASRSRIVAQMFVEALVLGGLAAVVGVTAADLALRTWAMTFLKANMNAMPFWFDLGLSPGMFVTAIALTVAAAAVAGIMPALKITRGMTHRLKSNSAGSGGLQFGGVWTVVIVAQVAATVIFPALVYWEQSQLRRFEDFSAGFATEQFLAVKIESDDKERLAPTLEELRRKVGGLPGVQGVTFTERVPTTSRPFKRIELGSNEEPLMNQATVAAVDPSYLETLGAPVLAGRGFTLADAGTRVAIVDQGFVDQVLQGRNAVGQQVRFRYPGPPERRWSPGNPDSPERGDWYEVIGVVRELGAGSPTTAGRAAGFYVPATLDQYDQVHLLVHVGSGDPMAIAPKVREAATAVAPSLRLVGLQRVNQVNDDSAWTMTLWKRMTIALSAVGLGLSLAGIYAVLSFTVARRTRDIGVRVALGASRRRVVAATFRRPLFQITLGVVVGTALVVTMAVLLKYTEFSGSETALTAVDIAMIVAYGVVMLGVCMLGCVAPTRRALKIEPTIALRAE
jgi:putative ABC transport system permease protein